LQKLGTRLIRAKGQTHPDSSKIDMSLCKIQKITLKVFTMKQELTYVSQVVYYLCGVLGPAFRKPFGSRLTKKTRFWHSKNGKHTFHGTKRKSAFMEFLAIPRATRMSDMAMFQQTMP
jgi:hypothetical protein